MRKHPCPAFPLHSVLPVILLIVFVFLTSNESRADLIFVSNSGAGTVQKIDSLGNVTTFVSGLNNPQGLAFDGAGNLYVANAGDGTISEISPAGQLSVYASGLSAPAALACDPSGNLYVASPGTQTISKIDPSQNASLWATGFAFNGDGSHLSCDALGNLYANTTRTIEKFDQSGNQSTLFTLPNYVEGMAVNGAGNLYYGLQNADSISGTGSLNTSPASYPAPFTDAEFIPSFAANFDAPADLAFDSGGNLFASFSQMYDFNQNSTVNDVIIEFGADGQNSVIATGVGGTYLAVAPVPEPGTWALFSCGLAVLLGFKKNRPS